MKKKEVKKKDTKVSAVKREQARKLFIEFGFSFAKIAKTLSVKEASVKKWHKEYDWDLIKDYTKITRKTIVSSFLSQIEAISKQVNEEYGGVPTVQHVMATKELTKSIETMQGEDTAYIILICEELMVYAAHTVPTKIADLQEVIKGFVNEKVR